MKKSKNRLYQTINKMGIILIRPVKDEEGNIRIKTTLENEILLKPQSFFIKKRLGRKIFIKRRRFDSENWVKKTREHNL